MGQVIVVDEFDENPRLGDREETHENGDYHRVSYLWLHNRLRQVLFHDRSIQKGKYYGGLKLPFNGEHHSDKDPLDRREGYLHAAMRAIEEYGIDPLNINLTFLKRMQIDKSNKDREFQTYFAGEFNGDISKLNFKKNEIKNIWWGDLENVALGDPLDIKKSAVVIPFPGNSQRIQIINPMMEYLNEQFGERERPKRNAS